MGTGDTTVNKRDIVCVLMELTVQCRRWPAYSTAHGPNPALALFLHSPGAEIGVMFLKCCFFKKSKCDKALYVACKA